MSQKRFLECTQNSIQNFTRYDKNVDIVTCWESFSKAYRRDFPEFNFDRFPSYKTGDNRWMNPNFTIYFDDRYGIAFLCYLRSGIAENESLFDKHIDRIRELDSDLKLEDTDGRMKTPKTTDIVLLSNSDSSQTFGHKIDMRFEDGSLDIDSNLILLEFDYLEQGNSKYRFKRLSHPDQNFRDDILPSAGKLSRRLSIEKGEEKIENIKIPLDEDFSELKATGVLTNKEPSNLYLACRLWDTVFKDKLTDDEWRIWRKEDPNKKITKEISCSEICDDLNSKYVPGANVSKEDVKRALKFIAVAKRAVQISDDEFRIEYSNLREKRRKHKDTASERSDVGDLAYLLASWHCETKVENSPKDIEEIITTESYNKADLSDITGADVLNL